MSQEACDNLNLVISNGNNQNEELFQNSQHDAMMLGSPSDLVIGTSGEITRQQEDDRFSPSSFSAPNTPLSSSNMVTTLELHPNVILGIPEDDPTASGSGDGDRPFMCAICHASYKTKTHLRRHMHIHMNSRPFPCSECGKGFNRKEHLNKHLEAVHTGNKHHCPYCDKQISRVDHLRRHIKNMHTNNPGEDSDNKGTVLKVQVRSRRHKAQLSFLTPNFPPGTIGQTIITPIPLSATPCKAVKVKDEDASNSNTSDTSNSSNSISDENSTTSMTIIPSNIVGPGEGVATLAVQSTPTQKVLVHQRLPSGSHVDFAAATSGLAGLADLSAQLGGHMPVVSMSGDESEKRVHQVQLFNCGECSSTFTSESELTAHSRATHPPATSPQKPQPYRCPECSRAYTRREKLTEHIRCVHQGQKFSCEFCGKELSRKDHVLRHIRSVHPEVYAASFAEIDESQIMLDEHGRLVSVSNGEGNEGGGGGVDVSSQQQSPPQQQGKKRRTPASASFNLPSLGDMGVLLRSVCHVCLKVFGTAYHLTRHVESCHSGDVRPFSCTACNKMFKRKDHLTKHVKSHCPTLKQEQQLTSAQQNAFAQQQEQQQAEIEAALAKVKEASAAERAPETAVELKYTEPKLDQSMSAEENEQVADLGGMLSDGSESNSNNCHAILQNLQVEMGVSSPEAGDSNSGGNGSNNNAMSSSMINTAHHGHNGDDDGQMGGVLISGAELALKHSSGNSGSSEQTTEFSLAVIDSFMQGGVNVVVVDEEISHFLQQTSSHLTTTFPCAQCQKEFPQRDQLIAHALQEHAGEALLQVHHHQQIADISFPDF